MLKREMIDANNVRFKADALLHPRDRERFGQWKTPYELPARGQLFKTSAAFAFNLQQQRGTEDKSQVRIDYDAALDVLSEVPGELKDSFLKAVADLQILDLPGDDVLFVHQLLQEYFAACHLAERIHVAGDSDAWAAVCSLAAIKWLEADISPSVGKLLQTLPKSGTLPDLPTTGWEETFRLNPLPWKVFLSEGLDKAGIGLFTETQLISVPLIVLAVVMLFRLRRSRAPEQALQYRST